MIIIHEDSSDRGPNILKLAKQLYTSNSIVRSLMYKSVQLLKGIPFKHRLLQIKDKEIYPNLLIDREYECEYKVLANEFLDSVQFTKPISRSLIFIQSSSESHIIANLMFANISRKPEFTIYRIIESHSNSETGAFPYIIDARVQNWKILSTLAARYLPEVCTGR